MPIVERDPWRLQYFADVACPESVSIPTEDTDSYIWYPRQRWVYNKLLICETQGLSHAPHGVPPPEYPVFSKPIYNLRGMGAGSRVIRSAAEMAAHSTPGHLWMPLLAGEHVSSDVAVVDGEPRWWRHAIGQAQSGGTFDHWTVLAGRRPEIEGPVGDWLRRHLAGYTGMVNLETIGATIIEAHLRFADQWPDLYGRGWLEAMVRLYAEGIWEYADSDRRDGFSVVLFGPHGQRYRPPPAVLVASLLQDRALGSVQITFHSDRSPAAHAMPPGGFRLAIVNGWNLIAGISARARLDGWFRSAAGQAGPG
ncbi:MAG: hypothetical protein EXQ96_01485 [Alphaproteobacteria bacterium]|nr:hypothetical protein [Alphaproteobacteria bacterium]